MEVNDDAGNLTPRSALRFFASKLAPTKNTLHKTDKGLHPADIPA
ncbi:hypothetical protein SAMN04490187_3380 [Pseudomonas jessenii]|uniref:Uncharacterized protein n=2 Tax=Pseudomonas TaxID=286 RepID=A0A1H4Q877_PSEJE|nr:hypothetical protein SAMN04490187_3380 [Pseudomonas jessenii]VVP71598.1 hypothetical protein PS922_00893 [Pseudomonas fluorescens]